MHIKSNWNLILVNFCTEEIFATAKKLCYSIVLHEVPYRIEWRFKGKIQGRWVPLCVHPQLTLVISITNYCSDLGCRTHIFSIFCPFDSQWSLLNFCREGCVVLGLESKALHVLANCSTTELHPQPLYFFFSLFFEAGSCYAVQAGLKLEILLPWCPECLHYSCMPPCPASTLLKTVSLKLGWSGWGLMEIIVGTGPETSPTMSVSVLSE